MSSSNDGLLFRRTRQGVLLRFKVSGVPAPEAVPIPHRLLAPDAASVPSWCQKFHCLRFGKGRFPEPLDPERAERMVDRIIEQQDEFDRQEGLLRD